jgi:RNA polymerase sigma-70 factor (ECF subfamily)
MNTRPSTPNFETDILNVLTTTQELEVASTQATTARQAAGSLTDPDRWVADYGDHLFGFAFSRLRNVVLAEDAVQETFLAALKGRNSFAGQAAEKTWLMGILKNKIHDLFRKSGRQANFTDLNLSQFDENGTAVDRLMQRAGLNDDVSWMRMGCWLDHGRFWEVYEEEVAKLPAKSAKAFHLREIEGAETMEICSRLGISESNLWVMIHRAKTALRSAFAGSEFVYAA